MATASEGRGRPRIHEDAEILDVALKAFAAQGFDAVSVRSLNGALGLSHGTISQRFGTKENLYFAAVDHGFTPFLAEIQVLQEELLADVGSPDDLDQLRSMIMAFLLAAWKRPELGRLMNQEGLSSTNRLEHIIETVLRPMALVAEDLLGRLRKAGRIRPVTLRALFFLVTHGAETPFTLSALSEFFDDYDGALDASEHSVIVTDILMSGLVMHAEDRPGD
jgi:AcrR family transcriptional regulator